MAEQPTFKLSRSKPFVSMAVENILFCMQDSFPVRYVFIKRPPPAISMAHDRDKSLGLVEWDLSLGVDDRRGIK